MNFRSQVLNQLFFSSVCNTAVKYTLMDFNLHVPFFSLFLSHAWHEELEEF